MKLNNNEKWQLLYFAGATILVVLALYYSLSFLINKFSNYEQNTDTAEQAELDIRIAEISFPILTSDGIAVFSIVGGDNNKAYFIFTDIKTNLKTIADSCDGFKFNNFCDSENRYNGKYTIIGANKYIFEVDGMTRSIKETTDSYIPKPLSTAFSRFVDMDGISCIEMMSNRGDCYYYNLTEKKIDTERHHTPMFDDKRVPPYKRYIEHLTNVYGKRKGSIDDLIYFDDKCSIYMKRKAGTSVLETLDNNGKVISEIETLEPIKVSEIDVVQKDDTSIALLCYGEIFIADLTADLLSVYKENNN